MLPKSFVLIPNWLIVPTTTSTARPSSMPSAAARASTGPTAAIVPSASRPAFASSLMALAVSVGLRPMATPISRAALLSRWNCSSVAPVLARTWAMASVKPVASRAASTNGAPRAAPPIDRFVPTCRIAAAVAFRRFWTRVIACWNLPSLAKISTYAPPARTAPLLAAIRHLRALPPHGRRDRPQHVRARRRQFRLGQVRVIVGDRRGTAAIGVGVDGGDQRHQVCHPGPLFVRSSPCHPIELAERVAPRVYAALPGELETELVRVWRRSVSKSVSSILFSAARTPSVTSLLWAAW